MSDMTWVVPGGGWPSGSSDDLTLDEVMDVLDQFDDYWDAALKSLDKE